MSLIVFALQRLSCPSMDSRFDSMHVHARITVTRHAMLVHSRISLLGPVAHACHSHERSSRFFVMHVHRTHTSIKVSASCIDCFVCASFLVFSSCCSPVSVSAPTWTGPNLSGCSPVQTYLVVLRFKTYLTTKCF